MFFIFVHYNQLFFHGARLSSATSIVPFIKFATNFKKITKISKNIFTKKVKDDNIPHSQGKIYRNRRNV